MSDSRNDVGYSNEILLDSHGAVNGYNRGRDTIATRFSAWKRIGSKKGL